jgi:hypothetical protein
LYRATVIPTNQASAPHNHCRIDDHGGGHRITEVHIDYLPGPSWSPKPDRELLRKLLKRAEEGDEDALKVRITAHP